MYERIRQRKRVLERWRCRGDNHDALTRPAAANGPNTAGSEQFPPILLDFACDCGDRPFSLFVDVKLVVFVSDRIDQRCIRRVLPRRHARTQKPALRSALPPETVHLGGEGWRSICTTSAATDAFPTHQLKSNAPETICTVTTDISNERWPGSRDCSVHNATGSCRVGPTQLICVIFASSPISSFDARRQPWNSCSWQPDIQRVPGSDHVRPDREIVVV